MINGCPNFSIDIDIKEEIIDVLQINQILAIITKTSVYIYHSYTLLPLGKHIRASTSLENNGLNIKARKKLIYSRSTRRPSKLNIYIQTDLNFLIIYQISIDNSSSIYEIHNIKEELIQNGLPSSYTHKKFSITNFISSATKTFIHGAEEISPALENIESVKNNIIDDELGGYEIESIKISVYKILKIGVGNQKFWLEPNSHNLLVFNFIGESIESNVLQIVKLTNFESKQLDLSTVYSGNVKNIFYNQYFNYFLIVGEEEELIKISITEEEGEEGPALGLTKIGFGNFEQAYFNPKSNLILAENEGSLKLYHLDDHLHEIRTLDMAAGVINWSNCGEFFTVVYESGDWKLVSKFGKILLNTKSVRSEINESNGNQGFLHAKSILISNNSMSLYILGLESHKIYCIPLSTILNDIIYDKEYFSIIEDYRTFLRFPLLPKFKKLLLFHDNDNLIDSNSQTEKLTISKNSFNQIAMSYERYLAISSPIATGGLTNHVLWYNFKSHFAEELNIVNQFWFHHFLIVVNRKLRHSFEEVDEEEHLIDEIIVFDTSKTKYAMSGEESAFTSDSLLWKYDFKSTFINIQLIDGENSSHVIILTSDFKIVILDLMLDKTVQTDSDTKHYKVFISINKTVHLKSLEHKINLKEVKQSSLIDQKHFIFLLQSGDLYLLKNSSRSASFSNKPLDALKPSNFYDLIKLDSSVEYFKFKTINFQKNINFIYMFNGQQILIYDVYELVDKAYNKKQPHHEEDDLLESEDTNLIPITIDTEEMIPFEIEADQKTINLIGFENLAINRHMLILKNKVSHKLILNNFIEFDLIHKGDLESTFNRYKSFDNFEFCLELLLFKLLTDEEPSLTLKRLCQLIEFSENSEFIYINCLRKIEVAYWSKFFDVINMTPEKFMNRLIKLDNVELCYNYLIVYLNYKREGDTEIETDDSNHELTKFDKQIILQIIKMLDKAGKYDWCFELCRFIKVLEPSGQFLKKIKSELE
ncbi:RIC1 [Candida jiufengensis]|uniref:RIC1 n=1 Tax=Candida jiufengensis TaxID=497108 RepID=UPI002225661F|nr:RIC1 [Candida jiufengensis]KAI5953589.1 RIC1 [Candida jiufengensis]